MLTTESTTFTLDNMGRYLCNTLQEAIDSTAVSVGGRPRGFDVIIIGGGTFGSVMAHKLFMNDKWRALRILVLEQGPFVIPEHQQNLPFGAVAPGFIVPWVPDTSLNPALNFAGLLYAVGGRSLAWGGWSPELLHNATDEEMSGWPASVVTELQSRYFLESSDQLGVSRTNDFIYGDLHKALRTRLFDGLGAAPAPANTVALAQLPDHPGVRAYQRDHGGALPSDDDLRSWLNLPSTSTMTQQQMRDLLKIEAPLAVQSSADPGQFPFNKFSAIPLLIKASRVASSEADGTGPEGDARKRVMVVNNVHVQELITETKPDGWVRVTGVRVVETATKQERVVPLAARESGESVVVIALGTIESTRLALTTFKESLSWRAAQRMGKNLMAHLRSNVNIRVPRQALTAATTSALQVSALFVKGSAVIDGVRRYFHLQITASGLARLGNDSEAELFKKIPDIDQLQTMQSANDTHVVITIRGIGEMTPHNPDSRVELASASDEFARQKAYVTLGSAANPQPGSSAQTLSDSKLWDAMDRTSDEIALLFANNMALEIVGAPGGRNIAVPANTTPDQLKALFPYKGRRDFLGTTHHEAGTLRMSDAPADGVTNDYGRIHDVTNCYVAGPALFPTIGSPNPMLTGVALCRRTADMLTSSVLPKPPALALEAGFTALFDGTGKTFSQWVRVPNGNGFALIGGEIVTYGTGDFGLLYYGFKAFSDFTLRLQFRVLDATANSGVFVRFRDPLRDPTAAIAARMAAAGDDKKPNRAWTAVHSGFEVQIDDRARGDASKDFYGIQPEPDGLRKNRTGAIYKIPAKDPLPGGGFDAEQQQYTPPPNLVPLQWYEMEIEVTGQHYVVRMRKDGDPSFVQVTDFTNGDTDRGLALDENGNPGGFIGLQSYPNSPVAFRHIRVKA
ncbi:MAG TPA: family 16 glycoside hydrolase [Thermoanaerobaculia bacterium]|jgi:choline dehydrogenase-like flavoprotein